MVILHDQGKESNLDNEIAGIDANLEITKSEDGKSSQNGERIKSVGEKGFSLKDLAKIKKMKAERDAKKKQMMGEEDFLSKAMSNMKMHGRAKTLIHLMNQDI